MLGTGWCGVNKHPEQVAGMWGGDDTLVRPHVSKARRTLQMRWQPTGTADSVVVFHGIRGPLRERLGDVLEWMQTHTPTTQAVVLATPLGIVPVSLEDLNPFGHLDASAMGLAPPT